MNKNSKTIHSVITGLFSYAFYGFYFGGYFYGAFPIDPARA